MPILPEMGRRGSSPHLVGRAEELGRLRAALARLGDGEPAGVFIGGEVGIGKSRLVTALAREAASSGVRVLSGACAVTSRGIAYAPIYQALRPLTREFAGAMQDWLVGDGRRELARLLPEFAGDAPASDEEADAAEGPHRLFAHLLDLLERLAGEQPVLLAVEDLHWADASTRSLLGFLVRNVRDVPVGLVGTYRTEHLRRGDPLRELLLDLDHSTLVERLELPPLDDGEVGELLAGILGVPPAREVCDDIAGRAEGNPLFCEELLAARGSGASWLPPTLRDLLLHRVESAGEEARHVVAVGAMLGHRLDHRLLAAVADLDEQALLAGVRRAVEHQLLIPEVDGRSYAFRHALFAEVVYDELAPGDRLRLHGAIAATLGDRPELVDGDVVAAQAHHWDAAGETERALVAHVEAARRAEGVRGFAEAHAHYARAAQLHREVAGPQALTSLERVDLLERGGQAAELGGDHTEAVRLLTEALRLADSAHAAVIEQRLGHSRLLAGDPETGAREMQAAVAALPRDATPRVRASLLAYAGVALMVIGRAEEARGYCEQAVALAQPIGAENIEARARNALGPTMAQLGEVETGISELERACALADRAGDPEELVRAHLNLQAILARAGRLNEAVEIGQQGIAHATRAGLDRWLGAWIRGNQVETLLELGRWAEARQELHELLAEAHGYAAAIGQRYRARLETGQGRFDAAGQALQAAHALAGSDAVHHGVTAELALWRGDPERALRAVHDAFDTPASPASSSEEVPAWLVWLGVRATADRTEVAAALRCHDDVASHHATAEALLDWLGQVASHVEPSAAAYAALAAAEVTRARLASDPAAWAAAAHRWDTFGNPYRAAYARWRQADALALAHAPGDDVVVPLRHAHASAAQLGAEPLRDVVERLAARTGTQLVADADHEPTRRPAHPAEQLGLTDREREVLALLAEGHTNQEIGRWLFITAKTASVHVSNILRKLDVSSRTEAAVIANRLDLLDHRTSSSTLFT